MNPASVITFLGSSDQIGQAYALSYNWPTVVVSILIAIFSSFCALELISRSNRSFGSIVAGGLMLGLGTWSMHFLGMMAIRIDCAINYDPWLTALSSLPGIAASMLALQVINTPNLVTGKLLYAGTLMGAGIGLMHFSGMASMQMDAILRYEPKLFTLSLVTAVAAAIAALKIHHLLAGRALNGKPWARSLASGSVLGLAISSMHYIAMKSVYFIPLDVPAGIEPTSPVMLARAVGLVTLVLLGGGLLFVILNAKAASARQRIDSILATTQQGFVLANHNGIIIDSNPALEKLLKVDAGSLKGRTMADVFGHDNAARMHGKYQLETLLRSDTASVACMVYGDSIWDAHRRDFLEYALVSDISARVQAEQLALAREAQFHSLLDATPDPMVICDEGGQIMLVNKQAETFFGCSREAMVGQPQHLLLPAGPLPEATQPPVGTSLTCQARLRDGRTVPVEVTLSPLATNAGTLTVSSLRDISDRLANEAAVREALTEQRAIFDSANAGIVVLKDRIIQRCNDNCNAMLGYTGDEQIGQSTRIWFTSDADYQAAGEHSYPLVWTGKSYSDKFRVRRKDGSLLWVRSSIRAMDLNDPTKGVVLMLIDITGEQDALAAIELANEEQRTILDTATSGVALVKDYTLTRCNRRLHEMCGWPLWEMVGRRTSSLYPDEESNRKAKALYEAIWRGIPSSAEVQMVRKDGSCFWTRIKGNAVDINQREKGTVWIVDDITEERRNIEALRQAKEEAEAATRSKSEFLSNMSHEIRTPMNAIIGMSQLALKTSLDPRQRNYIDKVRRAGENLLGIINDILDFSKIEAGKMSMEHTGFMLEEVIDNLASVLGIKAEDKGLELILAASANVPTELVGDPLRLGQVLLNLGNNAVKFTDKGEIVIGVETVSQSDEQAELHFWVRDSGIGMTAEQCSRLFQPFTQADTSTSRKYGGTGLGLAISKNLVDMMQGRIWAESEIGKGSTFHFQLSFGVQTGQQVKPMLTEGEMKGLQVLVVDDNTSAREILAEMAQSIGLLADKAASGTQALSMYQDAQAQQRPYSLVLTDWRMPEMDGVELLRRLQQQSGICAPAAIMVTAYAREDAIIAARNHQVSIASVLNKPVTPSSLLETVGAALGQRSAVGSKAVFIEADSQQHIDKLRGARVLLVEDNDMNKELAQELLASAGIAVVAAGNGREALDILAGDTHFDGVLMDCQMPVMDGYAATLEIRKLPEFAHLPIIAMTANAMPGDREKVLAVGMSDYIAKPLNIDAMFATMAKWIKPATIAPSPVPKPAAATHPDHPELPAQIEGIDIREGLGYCMNSGKLYRRMLLKFRDGQAHFGELLAQAGQDTDPHAQERCAHTLKGSAASLGARHVAQAAGELEAAFKAAAPATEINAKLQTTLSALAVVINSLAALDAN